MHDEPLYAHFLRTHPEDETWRPYRDQVFKEQVSIAPDNNAVCGQDGRAGGDRGWEARWSMPSAFMGDVRGLCFFVLSRIGRVAVWAVHSFVTEAVQ